MVNHATGPYLPNVQGCQVTHRPAPEGNPPTRDEMDALRDVAFHHPVEADMGVRLQSLGLIEVKRGALVLTAQRPDTSRSRHLIPYTARYSRSSEVMRGRYTLHQTSQMRFESRFVVQLEHDHQFLGVGSGNPPRVRRASTVTLQITIAPFLSPRG
jgi:hypothetical protein